MKQADFENKGKISFEDFTKIMKSMLDTSHWIILIDLNFYELLYILLHLVSF